MHPTRFLRSFDSGQVHAPFDVIRPSDWKVRIVFAAHLDAVVLEVPGGVDLAADLPVRLDDLPQLRLHEVVERVDVLSAR